MNKSVKELSEKELRKDLKSKKNIFGYYLLIIMVMTVCAIIITINKGANVFIFMPFAFAFFLFRSWRNYFNLREEIKTRSLK